MGLAVLVGSVLAGGLRVVTCSVGSLAIGYSTGFLLTASSMVLNDYADREIDSINEPSRPIPAGVISPKGALSYGILLMAAGIFSAYLIGLVSLLVAMAAWFLFLSYTLFGKKTGFFGNILVSLCVAVPFLYGAAILGTPTEPRIAIFASVAFMANLGREVNKGIVDVEGDKMKGVRTVAVRYGRNPAAWLSAIFYMLAVGISILPILWVMISILYYLPFVLITDLGLGFSALSILRDPSRQNARTQKRFVLLWMLFGLVAFLTGSVR